MKSNWDQSLEIYYIDLDHIKYVLIRLQYELVTPLTSLVVVKPNATDAVNAESVDKGMKHGKIIYYKVHVNEV